MASNKRKNVFKPEFEKELVDIKKSRKGEGYFCCSLCDEDINLESMGKSAITLHQTRAKHLNAVKIRNANQTMTAFLPSKSAPSSIDFCVAAAEGQEFKFKSKITKQNKIKGHGHIMLQNITSRLHRPIVFLRMDFFVQCYRIRTYQRNSPQHKKNGRDYNRFQMFFNMPTFKF
jgi:hypothetical protein